MIVWFRWGKKQYFWYKIYLNKGNAILEYQQTKQNNFKFLAEMLSLILTEFRKGMKILLKL